MKQMIFQFFIKKATILLFLPFIFLNNRYGEPSFSQVKHVKTINNLKLHSKFLKREVVYDVILPPNYENISKKLKVLYMNDGQDKESLKIEKTLDNLFSATEIEPLILVAIHTDENRMKEYGTASMPDYKNRGNLAQQYNDFIINEMTHEIVTKYHASSQKEDNYFCGFSLGGLSAIDIVWANPERFSRVGVFSGSFWWRKKAYEDGYDDHNDRIMHVLVRNGKYNAGQKFWFECGTNDEKDDRNGNGIIDSIDDTHDLISELQNKGYENEKDIVYYEIMAGEHNQKTWSEAMPVFLKWLVGKG